MLQKFTKETYLKRWTCGACETEMEVHFLEFIIFHFCKTCYQYVEPVEQNRYSQWIDNGKCCSNADKEIVEVIRNGSRLIREQCQSCGCVFTKAFKRDNTKVYQTENTELRALYELSEERMRDEYSKFRNEIAPKLKQKASEFRRTSYENYLLSPKWKQKRLLVFNRDKYVCQSCFSARATEVHHLEYTFLKNEPLFTLLSVCRPCHKAIEAMKKGERAEEIVHHSINGHSINNT